MLLLADGTVATSATISKPKSTFNNSSQFSFSLLQLDPAAPSPVQLEARINTGHRGVRMLDEHPVISLGQIAYLPGHRSHGWKNEG